LPSATFPDPRVLYAPSGDPVQGRQAAAVAALGGVQLDPAQKFVLEAGCDRRGGRWSAPTVGLIVPRQNLKSVCLRVRELAGLLLWGERLAIHSAHQWRSTALQFNQTVDMITGSPLRRYLPERGGVRRAAGEESITFRNGATLRFMTRSKENARSFSADFVALDEAHAMSEAEAGALLPVISARPDAQCWWAAHGPAPGSWALARLRNRALSADPGAMCWVEWSADPLEDDLEDEEVWRRVNPAEAAGRLTIEKMREERRTLGADRFRAERLAAAPWPSEEAGAWGTFTESEWKAMLEA
jgi:hypothetical protein